jgi:hypothetical protein
MTYICRVRMAHFSTTHTYASLWEQTMPLCNKVSLKRFLRKLILFRYVTGRYLRSSVIEKSLLMESSKQ